MIMQIYPVKPYKDWYIAKGFINGKACTGYGKTHTEAMDDCFKDYKTILNLRS